MEDQLEAVFKYRGKCTNDSPKFIYKNQVIFYTKLGEKKGLPCCR
jgi:hypothetical protein